MTDIDPLSVPGLPDDTRLAQEALVALVDTVLPGAPDDLALDGPEPGVRAAVPAGSRAGLVPRLRAVLADERPEWTLRLIDLLGRLDVQVRDLGHAAGASFALAAPAARSAALDALLGGTGEASTTGPAAAPDPDAAWAVRLVHDLWWARAGDDDAAAEVVRDLASWRPGLDAAAAERDGLAWELPADAAVHPSRLADRYDVVVVGSGAAGSLAARDLARSGRSVLLVERGAWPSTRALATDHLRNPRSASGLDARSGPVGTDDPRTVVVAGATLPVRPADAAWRGNAMTVGGGTRVYGAQAWRFAPDDFSMATRYGVPEGSSLADWPICYDDLEPWYDRVEWELGVSGDPVGDPWAGPRRRGLPMPPFPPTLASEVLGRGAAELGLGTLPVPLLVNTTPWGGRSACVRCARCVGFACPVDAKTGTHQTALPDALATGLVQLVTGARAQRVTTDAAGRVTGVALVGDLDGGTGGPGVQGVGTWRREVRAGDVVVAAGAIESARLLLSSTSDREPEGLGNARDQVGRHLQGHVYGGATAVFDDVVVDLLGPGPSIATSDHRHGASGVVGGGMLANEFVPTPASTFRTLADAGLVPLHGRGSVDGMRELAPRLMKVMGPAQEVTTSSSRVRLSRLRDAQGSQVAHLEGDLHEEDVRTQAFLSARAAEWLTASGARRVVEAGRLAASAGPSAGQHQAGTCRMGDDPATSVVDRDGLVWGHDNLRVVDGSTHVTNGGVNPVLTIMANALRMTAAMTG